MDLTYKNIVTAEEVNHLRASVGFRQILPEQLQPGLDGSTFIVAACDHDEVVGFSRLIWDGGMVALIPDVLIAPTYYTPELHRELITRILDFLQGKLQPGFGIQVDIRAWDQQEAFYESLGFQISTREQRGTPMHICLTDQIELTDAKFKQCEFAE